MGYIRINRGIEKIEVVENGYAYARVELDRTDSSVFVSVGDDPDIGAWFWLRRDDDMPTIDELIEALQTAKKELEDE